MRGPMESPARSLTRFVSTSVFPLKRGPAEAEALAQASEKHRLTTRRRMRTEHWSQPRKA